MNHGERQVGFGILGCGVIGEFHAKALAEVPAAKLVAVADADAARAQALAKEVGCGWHSSLGEMLQNSEVDAVTICTPTGLHADQGMEAAQAGRHVLLEKPMDRNLAKVNRLISYCMRRGLKLGCVFQYRFIEGAQRIKTAIDEGRFGRLVSGSAEIMWYRSQEYYESAAWRGSLELDGGCLWNQAVHYIDLLCWMLGKPKKILCAHLDTLERDIEAEDFGVAQVLFRNGAVGSIRATTVTYPGLPARLEICGTKGSAVLTNHALTHYAAEGEEEISAQADGVGTAADPKALKAAGHAAQIQDFAEAILFDRTPMVDGLEGRQAVKLLNEIYRVAGMGRMKSSVSSPEGELP